MDISSCLASNYKVLHYLNSKSMLSCADATRSTGYFPLKDQIRFRAGSDGDSSIQSDSSPVSSLSDPVADSCHDSSTNSFTEEFDFSLTFDRISSDDDSSSDDDDDQDNDRCSAIFNKDYLRQSSQMTLINDNDHDSTFTRSVDEDFSDDSDGLSPVVLRSNSIDILQWDKTSTVMEKPSKKAVRFADMMGLDLESIRYMTPPDPSSSSAISLNDSHIRLKLEQIRLNRSLSMLSGYVSASAPSKQYNLVARNFIPPRNIIPKIYEQRIVLECLYTKDSTAYGTIRVHNFVYEKRVFVRLTKDEWKTHQDIQAWHSMNYPHDQTDVFTFQINLPKSHDQNDVPQRLLFALALRTATEEFWDNNQNNDYILDVYEKRSRTTNSE